MALSPYQAPPFRTMDDAQHIPTSAQHGAKHTMANVALTQQMSVLDTTMVAGKFRALYMAMVQSKPSNDLLTHHPPPPETTHAWNQTGETCYFYSLQVMLDLDTFWHGYTLIFLAPRAEYTQNLQQDPCTPPATESLFPHISASHGD
jgi:hypothetical protein